MSQKRPIMIALGLAAVGVFGLAMLAMGQAGATPQQEYEQKLKNTDRNNVDALVALAKWCYQYRLTGEAMNHALEANQKAPDDVRPKYLIFALSGPPGEITGGDDYVVKPKELTLSAEAVDKLYKQDLDALNKFKDAQNILIQRCGSPKCHGGLNETSKWALVTKNLSDRRTTAENFHTIYPYLNRDRQEESRLLQKSLKGPEGGHCQQALRTTSDPAYNIILKWIRTVQTDAQIMWNKNKGGRSP